ncbi:Protein N-acetyltransferase, RimJ/RimL family [Anaerocolumna jejuensis DSM 15929]|uniref:Protein N-acetyltransferase, RimJ/RimL family n=1 Tax=Anaerocolumna jejuensis DSM 15929 TaxID=1121322 RepID=A0A1M6QN62_9FIRM|nr:GNAT family N-acetyltransferase [Anaerocolumna jejuensis]SHK21605.1 Protein N-acetyltransferase, RimJ/RimL family [Anaerocolumna jejuensis DSM 15929]
MYFLKSERIGFSKWTEKDIELARSLWGEKNVTRYLCASGTFTEEEIKTRLGLEIENQKKFGVQYWPVFELATGDFIGCCGLRPYKLEEGIFEIGFHLKERFWGKGFANEGAKAVIQYAFEQLQATDIFAGHNPHNVNSGKALERLGFHYISDEFYPPTGLYHPSYKYK